jgi:uncharacterized caspase-like protein
MSQTFAHGYALFVGVGKTYYPSWSLPVTVKDAQALASIFTDANLCAYPNNEQHIRLLHDSSATRQAILDGVNWLREKAADPEATIVLYYSGHGWLDTSTGLYYLIPHDVKPHKVPNSALSAQAFTDALRAIQARRLLVVIDSCHAEGMAAAKDDHGEIDLPPGFTKMTPPKSMIDILKQGEGRAVFTSSRGTQLSYVRPDQIMSIYTYHLIEALLGAGNREGDMEVHLSNLMNHLGKTVPASVQQFYQQEQTPFFDAATEDFAVALLRGGKGLPVGGWDTVKHETGEATHRVVQAYGERNVAIGGDVSGSTIITGNHNITW